MPNAEFGITQVTLDLVTNHANDAFVSLTPATEKWRAARCRGGVIRCALENVMAEVDCAKVFALTGYKKRDAVFRVPKR